MAEFTRQVGIGSDDAYRRLTTTYWSFAISTFRAGAFAVDYYQGGSGARFTNITIPRGDTILEAYLTLRASDSDDGTVVNTRISAEKIDDAPTFVDNAAAFDARWANRTTARVDWVAIPAWTAGEDYVSPDIKTVIKEIIDRPGWESGFDIVIFWDDFEDESTHAANCNRRAESYDGSTEFAPKLFIKYTPPVVGWTGKISGVTNPAKIMGVDVANIHSVKGVVSG